MNMAHAAQSAKNKTVHDITEVKMAEWPRETEAEIQKDDTESFWHSNFSISFISSDFVRTIL